MATTGSSGRSYAERYCALIEPIRRFVVSHGSRRDSEMSWLLDVRTPTNSTDTFISSQATKRSVLEAEWACRAELVLWRICPVFDRTEQDNDRTGQGREGQGSMRTGEAAFLGFNPSDILVDRTRVSALPICPIIAHTFVWLNFLAQTFFLKSSMIF